MGVIGVQIIAGHWLFGETLSLERWAGAILIIWTFNPDRLPGRSLLQLRRSEMWMSREAFLRRFGR